MNKKQTPREQIKELEEKSKNKGFYDINTTFIRLIESRLSNQATKILNSLNDGFLWSNPRLIYNKIYNDLLDGIPIKKIKEKFRGIQ
jgi:hypothetical protein